MLYLLLLYQRQGIGRQLVAYVVERLDADGLYSLLMRVLKDNTSARRFYEALG